jgi:hypothetical protein
MTMGRRPLIGWPSGTSIDSQDTLSFTVLSGVRSMNEEFPLEGRLKWTIVTVIVLARLLVKTRVSKR